MFFSKKSVFAIVAIFVTMLWGSAFPMVKKGYELFQITQTGDKILFAALRFTLAGAVLLIVSMLRPNGNAKRKINGISAIRLNSNRAKLVFLMALVRIALNYFFYYIGLSNTAGGVASIVNSFDTFLSVLLVPLFFKSDKLTTRKILGALIGFSGIILVNLGNGFSSFSLFGEGFILFSALFSTFGIMLNKKVATAIEPITASGYFLFVGGLMLCVTAFFMGGKINLANVSGTLVLLYLSCVSALAFMLWSTLLKHNDVSKTGVFKLLIPVFGNVLSALILHENIFSVEKIFSIILVAIGIALVRSRKKAERKF